MTRATTRLTDAVCFALLLGSLAGCVERAARVDEPVGYERAGLHFEHPGNWKVSEDTSEGEVRYLFVESPGAALVTIQVYPASWAPGLREFAEQLASAFSEELPLGELRSSEWSAVSREGEYELLTESFSISLLGESVPHRRDYRRKGAGDRVLFVMTQVADEDRSKVVAGFEQILSSLSAGA